MEVEASASGIALGEGTAAAHFVRKFVAEMLLRAGPQRHAGAGVEKFLVLATASGLRSDRGLRPRGPHIPRKTTSR